MVATVADQLKQFRHQLGKHVFFIGSGATLQPYDKPFEQILRQMALDYAADRVAERPPDERWREALQILAREVPDHAERCRMLSEYLKDLRPGEGHVQLARLIKYGYVPTLFTTCADDSLERALAMQRLVAGEDYHLVVAGRDELDDIAVAVRDSARVAVVKCGGDINSKFLPLTEAELEQTIQPLADLIAEVFRSVAIIVAYSDRDRPFLRLIPRDGEKIYWVNVHIPVADRRAVDEMRLESPDAEQFHKLQPEVVELLAARNSQRNLLCREQGKFSEFFGRIAERLRRRRDRRAFMRKIELDVLRGGPYKLLDAFDVHDADYFFGREEETERLTNMVMGNRLTVLFARLAIGKTSLLRAGLMVHLRKETESAPGEGPAWLPAYARCFAEPLPDIRAAVAAQVEDYGYSPDAVLSAETLPEIAAAAAETTKHIPVIILDNVHELFLKVSAPARAEFISQLGKLVADESIDARVVLSIREEYLGELYELQDQVPTVMHNMLRLHKLTREQAEDAIVKPAANFGKNLERELVEQILEDLDREGVMPHQLQIVCHRLMEEVGPIRRHVSLALYRRLGGARRIIDEFLPHSLSKLTAADRRLAWSILRNLAEASETLAAVPLSELQRLVSASRPALDRVLARLVDLRLVRPVQRNGERHYELIHEILAEDIRRIVRRAASPAAQTAHDILARGIDRFRLTGQVLDRGEMHAVNDERSDLTLSEQELELAIRSAVANDIDAEYWLGRIGDIGDRKYAVLADMLSSPDPKVRSMALTAARDHLSPELIRPLVDVAHRDEEQAEKARALLRQMERHVVRALQSPDTQMRAAAAGALALIGRRKHIQPLVDALSDEHPAATEAIAEALWNIDPVRAADAIIAQISRGRSSWAAAEALGSLARNPRALSRLRLAIDRHPTSPLLQYALGLVLLRQRQLEAAEEALQRALTLARSEGYDADAPQRALERCLAARRLSQRGEDRWPMLGGGARHLSRTSVTLHPPLEPIWTTAVGGEIVGAPLAAEGRIYIARRDGSIVCADLATGQIEWRARCGDRIEVTPAISSQGLVVITADARLRCLSDQGRTVWHQTAPSPPRSPLTVADELLIWGDRAGAVFCLSLHDRRLRWQFEFEEEVTSAPAAADGLVVVGSWDASVACLDLSDGNLKWRWRGDSPVAGAIALDGGIAFWATDAGEVIAARASDGQILWKASLPAGARAGPAVGEDFLVVSGLDGTARALRKSDGGLLWEFETEDQIVCAALIAGPVVYIPSRDGALYAASSEDGAELWRHQTSYGIYATPAAVEGILVAAMRQQELVAMAPAEQQNE